MTATRTIILLTFCTVFFACRQTPTKERPIHPDWTTLTLPNGWTIQTPKGFKIKNIQGVDSDPGYIYNSTDSIAFEFDCGVELSPLDTCDFEKELQNRKQDISTGFYKDFYKVPMLHKAFIDTVDNKLVTIVIPTTTGKGTVGINIHDCESHRWLGIRGGNLSATKEKLALEIYRTIHLTNNNVP